MDPFTLIHPVQFVGELGGPHQISLGCTTGAGTNPDQEATLPSPDTTAARLMVSS